MNWGSRFRISTAVVLLGATIALSGACGPPRGRFYVRVGPPAPIVEVRAISPGAGYVWIEGYHRWDGRGYVWEPGRWERPPRVRAVWVPAHWERDRRGWFFIEGHWR